ncbi:unnamed protein product [Closterium sp. NIES-54]
MTSEKDWFEGVEELNEPVYVELADRSHLLSSMAGTIRATAPDGTTVRFTDVLYVPGLKSNLLSYCQLHKKGARIRTRDDCNIEITMAAGDEHVVIGIGMIMHGVLMMQYEPALTSAHESGHDHPNEASNEPGLGGLNVQSAHALITYRMAHKRLGHPSYTPMDATFRNGDVEGLSIPDKTSPLKPPCDSCLRGKMSKAPFPTGGDKRTTRPLELVHSDIMDLGDAHPSLRYVLTLKDDYTNYLWVAPLARRSDMATIFSAWHREMKTKLPTKPLAALRTDNGGEYTANAFTDYLSSHSINHQTSLPHTPQQFGVAERVNRTLMDRVRAMTTGASLSSKFWPYALEYAAWLHNRISCSSNPSAHSPNFMMTGKAADVSMARTFGCLCYYLPPQGSFGKFEQRGRTSMFLGLSNSQKAWIVRDLASDVDTDTRSARFFYDLMLPDVESVLERQRYLEEVSPHIDGSTSGGEGFGSRFDSFPASPPSPTLPTTARGQEVDATQEDSPINDAAETGEGATASDLPPAGVSVPEVVESNNMENEASNLYDFAYPPDGIELATHDATPRWVHFNPTMTVLGREEQGTDGMTGLDVLFGKQRATQAFNMQQHVLGCAATGIPMVDLTYKEPKTLKDMTTDPYAPLWQAAVDAELAKFDELEAYEVVDRADVPKGTTVLTEGVVLRVKRDEHGQPNRFKARWVVKGCGQTWRTYDGTYAPVSQGPTSRMFVAGASTTKRKVVQLDISNAFLYAAIVRDIYVRPPEPRRDGDKVWKLKRSVYGLKQAPRLWHQHLRGVLLELDMVQSESDPS